MKQIDQYLKKFEKEESAETQIILYKTIKGLTDEKKSHEAFLKENIKFLERIGS